MCLTNSVSYNGCSRIPEVCASLVYHVTNTFSLPFFLCFCLVMTIKEVLNKWDELKNQICYFCCYGFHSDMARSLIKLVQHIVVIEFTHLKKFSNISMVISLTVLITGLLHIYGCIFMISTVLYILTIKANLKSYSTNQNAAIVLTSWSRIMWSWFPFLRDKPVPSDALNCLPMSWRGQ